MLFRCLSVFSCFVCWYQGCLLFFPVLCSCFCLECHCTYLTKKTLQVCVDPPCHVLAPLAVQMSVSLGPPFARLWVDMTARHMGYGACWGHRWCCLPFVEMATALKVYSSPEGSGMCTHQMATQIGEALRDGNDTLVKVYPVDSFQHHTKK